MEIQMEVNINKIMHEKLQELLAAQKLKELTDGKKDKKKKKDKKDKKEKKKKKDKKKDSPSPEANGATTDPDDKITQKARKIRKQLDKEIVRLMKLHKPAPENEGMQMEEVQLD